VRELPDHQRASLYGAKPRYRVAKATAGTHHGEWWVSESEKRSSSGLLRVETADGAAIGSFGDAPTKQGGRWWLHGVVKHELRRIWKVTTHFSFLRGVSSPEECSRRGAARDQGARRVDRNSLAGNGSRSRSGKKYGVRLIVGCRLSVNANVSFFSLV